MIASVVVVAADELILPGVQHQPATCPICALAQCLANGQLPSPVLWIEPSNVHWLPPETVCILAHGLSAALILRPCSAEFR